jgi:GxxExxY protein
MNKIIEDELTYKIIGCAMKVHNTLGNGFQEVIYQRALFIESVNQQVEFERQCLMNKKIKGHHKIT